MGTFGKSIQSFSNKIIQHNLAHFIATDAHNIGSRGFTLRQAYETIFKSTWDRAYISFQRKR
ncbi:CpsB/CapC family capsule biosynthesis tyrosine phosphatase [Peribacillus frigoritolerans]|nr:CpsB/CapC family capsule biosynthesis tyrosine phosphatase [Peribacillus frigoritolerans]